MENVASKISALEALRALFGKKAPVEVPAPVSAQDPAIVGASRAGNVVKLGVDPSVKDRAALAASLKLTLEKAEEEFSYLQAEIRTYGKEKRDAYNDTFKSSVTTVSVPYADGEDTKWIQVVCTNRYTVQKDVVLNNKDRFGGHFDRLFNVETTKKLKPEGEILIKNLLSELGLAGQELTEAMGQLFDTEHKVTTKEDYETVSKEVTEEGLKTILSQAVTRAQPALKF